MCLRERERQTKREGGKKNPENNTIPVNIFKVMFWFPEPYQTIFFEMQETFSCDLVFVALHSKLMSCINTSVIQPNVARC